MNRRLAWLVLVLASASGCASMKDCVDDCMIRMRNCRSARGAWRDYEPCVRDIPHRRDFGRGFRDGYATVAGGGSICQPALPPECYWRYCHESAEGQAQMHAWFDGFSHGAAVADQDGVAQTSHIVIAPSVTPPSRRKRPPPVDLSQPPADGLPPVVPFADVPDASHIAPAPARRN